MKKLSTVLSTLFIAYAAQAAEYRPQILKEVRYDAAKASLQGERPVVIFDLDDTLINTRERNLRIFRDFLEQPGLDESYPAESEHLAAITLAEVRYLLKDTMAGIGIFNSEFVAKAQAFWDERFFTNRYAARDQQIAGAVSYVKALAELGTKIVYLTGRDSPRMGRGTKYNLIAHGFPLDGKKAILMMKPDAKHDDLEFKRQAFSSIEKLGKVIAVFENEPANLNAMKERFPNATAVFLDTIHSPKPIKPDARAFWVPNFMRSLRIRDVEGVSAMSPTAIERELKR